MKTVRTIAVPVIALLCACSAQEQNQTQHQVQQQVQQAVRSVPTPVKQGVSDAALAAAVESAIAAQAGVNVFHVAPTVHQGIVTLKGTVPTPALKATVLSAARGVHGVKETIDQIIVRR